MSESRPYQPHPAPALMSQVDCQDDLPCRWCGDPNVVFTNRLGPHCPDCYREGLIDQALHEASL